jgi:hypothetical protein
MDETAEASEDVGAAVEVSSDEEFAIDAPVSTHPLTDGNPLYGGDELDEDEEDTAVPEGPVEVQLRRSTRSTQTEAGRIHMCVGDGRGPSQSALAAVGFVAPQGYERRCRLGTMAEGVTTMDQKIDEYVKLEDLLEDVGRGGQALTWWGEDRVHELHSTQRRRR